MKLYKYAMISTAITKDSIMANSITEKSKLWRVKVYFNASWFEFIIESGKYEEDIKYDFRSFLNKYLGAYKVDKRILDSIVYTGTTKAVRDRAIHAPTFCKSLEQFKWAWILKHDVKAYSMVK
jgi:hypothetical protein